MELRHLRYFAAVADSENVSAAALKLHVSQPAVSRQVRDLEEELGFALFERGPRSLRLTPGGRALRVEVAAVLERLETGIQAARIVAHNGNGTLEVGYAMSPTARFLPPALRAFQEASPGRRVRLRDLSTEEMLTGLRSKNLHLAFLVRTSPRLLRGLRFEELARVALCLAVSNRDPLAGRLSVSLTEVVRHPLIAFSRKEYPDYHEMLATLFRSHSRRPRIAEEHDSVASLIASVEAGTGVAIVAESIACTAGPRLKLLELETPPKPLSVGAAWLESSWTPAAELFLACARQAGSESTAVENA